MWERKHVRVHALRHMTNIDKNITIDRQPINKRFIWKKKTYYLRARFRRAKCALLNATMSLLHTLRTMISRLWNELFCRKYFKIPALCWPNRCASIREKDKIRTMPRIRVSHSQGSIVGNLENLRTNRRHPLSIHGRHSTIALSVAYRSRIAISRFAPHRSMMKLSTFSFLRLYEPRDKERRRLSGKSPAAPSVFLSLRLFAREKQTRKVFNSQLSAGLHNSSVFSLLFLSFFFFHLFQLLTRFFMTVFLVRWFSRFRRNFSESYPISFSNCFSEQHLLPRGIAIRAKLHKVFSRTEVKQEREASREKSL